MYAADDLTVTVTKSDDTSFSNTFIEALTITAGKATAMVVEDVKTVTLTSVNFAGSEMPKWDSSTKKIVFGYYNDHKSDVSGNPYILNQYVKIYKFNVTGGNHYYVLSDKQICMSGDLLYFFENAVNVNIITLDNFNTESVTDMSGMFYYLSSLKTIYVDTFVVPGGIDSDDMFYGCSSLVGGNETTYNSSHTNAEYARIDTSGIPGYFTKI